MTVSVSGARDNVWTSDNGYDALGIMTKLGDTDFDSQKTVSMGR